MKRTLLVFLFALATFVGYSQGSAATEAFDLHVIPAKKGAILAYAGKEHGFTFTIEADSVRPMEAPGFFYVNGQVFQSSLVAIPAQIFKDTFSEKRQHEIILAYIQYELEYFKKELKINFRELEMHPVTYQGKPYVFWHFSMPKENKGIKKQVYLTSILFNQTHSLNMPVWEGQTEEGNLALMTQVASTLKVFNKALDIENLKTQAR
ncbi:hypothetical protein [Rufibacter soli]